jgi:pimeloyl-ACP methyl ester carboxylesterase
MTSLPNPLGGERHIYHWRGYEVAYVLRGQGSADRPPLVFVHSVHAAAWSAEWRHNIPVLAGEGDFAPGVFDHDNGDGYTCYAIDLLGFGASDRPPLHYQAPLYIDLIRDFLADVVGQPAVLIGSSLGGTYAVAVAAGCPELVRAVVAIGPAGVTRLAEPGGWLNDAVQGLLRSNVPGTALFSALVSRASIGFFLKDIYADPKAMTAETLELFRVSAAEPGARFAPAAFVGMSLNWDIRTALPSLTCPFLLLWGTEASATPFKEAAGVRALVPDAPYVALPGGDLPHDERPVAFNESLLNFLETVRETAIA